MSGKLQIVIVALLLSGCGTTDIVVKDRRIVCPSDAPPKVCGTIEPASLTDLLDALDVCEAEADTWRTAWDGCFDD